MKRIVLPVVFMITTPFTSVRADNEFTKAVPEPSTIILLGLAIAALGFYLFWRSKKKKR